MLQGIFSCFYIVGIWAAILEMLCQRHTQSIVHVSVSFGKKERPKDPKYWIETFCIYKEQMQTKTVQNQKLALEFFACEYAISDNSSCNPLQSGLWAAASI